MHFHKDKACYYWVTQKLPQICTVILRIRIGKDEWFSVYICGNLWVTQHCIDVHERWVKLVIWPFKVFAYIDFRFETIILSPKTKIFLPHVNRLSLRTMRQSNSGASNSVLACHLKGMYGLKKIIFKILKFNE